MPARAHPLKLLVIALAAGSCALENPRLIFVDAGLTRDRGAVVGDTGSAIDVVRDTGVPDTGVPDTGIDADLDTGVADTSVADTGVDDTGVADTGVDTGAIDTGTLDTGTDSGTDAGVDSGPRPDVPPVACGAPGQPCCGFNCNAGAECTLAGLGLRCETAACGGDLQRCCGPGICAAGFDCTLPVVGRCERCGARTQRCCGMRCDTGLTCRGQIFMFCN